MRLRVSINRFSRKALHNQAAERAEIHQLLEFNSVTKGSGGGDDWVLKGDPAKCSGERRPRRVHASAAEISASPKTRPVAEEGHAVPATRAKVGARSIHSTAV